MTANTRTRCLAHFVHVRFRGIGRPLRVIALLACALASAACSRTPTGPRAVFEVAEVVSPGTPGAISVTTFDPPGGVLHIVDPVRFEVARTSLQPDSRGTLGIAFDLATKDHGRFWIWSKARVGRTVVMMADREALTVATIGSPLPGSGILELGPSPRGSNEVRALAERIAPLD